MPKGKRKYTSKKKSKMTKKKKYPRYRPLPLGGFAESATVRLKYVELVSLDQSSAASSLPLYHSFRANSCFDPSLTGVGHQPRGYDEWSAIYDHYCVIGSKIKVTFESDVDHISSAGQYCFLVLQDTDNSPESIVDIMENSDRNKIAYRPRSTTTGKSVTLTKNFSPHKFFGIPRKDSILNNSRMQAQIGANPAEDAIYTVGVICNRTTSTNPPTLIARVEIEYITVFSEKRPMSIS